VQVTVQEGQVYYDGIPYSAECFYLNDRYYFKLQDVCAAANNTLQSQSYMAETSGKSKNGYPPLPQYNALPSLYVSWDATSNTVNMIETFTDIAKIFTDERNSQVQPTPTPAPVPVVPAQPLLTSPPTVGTTLANIFINPNLGDMAGNLTVPYAETGIGWCNCYAYGRLYETTGVDTGKIFPVGIGAAFLNDVISGKYTGFTGTTDITNIPARGVAIWASHVVFVEYVERDTSGNPVNVYYTESNSHDSEHTKAVFYPGYDGIVKVASYNDWLNKTCSGNPLLGYVYVK